MVGCQCRTHKKGSREDPGNYRLAYLTSIPVEMEVSVTKSKITGHVDKLGMSQADFAVKGNSARDLLELSDAVRRCL